MSDDTARDAAAFIGGTTRNILDETIARWEDPTAPHPLIGTPQSNALFAYWGICEYARLLDDRQKAG